MRGSCGRSARRGMLHNVRRSLETPWKVGNELERWLILPWVRLRFGLSGVAWGEGWRFYGVPIIQRHRRSRMVFGPGLQLRSAVRSNPLGPNRPVMLTTWQAGAALEIGANFAMTGGTICAGERIIIGDNVVVGANTTIIDTDFHPIDPALRRAQPNVGATAPIFIQDEVFIGMNCLVLKGVTLGRGSVVGAGSVVTRDAPAGAVVSGNPARVVSTLSTD